VQTRRWVNQSQPQTLVIATFLLYAGVLFVVLGSGTNIGIALANSQDGLQLLNNLGRVFVAVGGAFAGYQIAQEKKLGYYLGIAVAALPLVADVIALARNRINFVDLDLVNLIFEIALLALILHTQSRNYVRLWFK
jgi:hypothetical protein